MEDKKELMHNVQKSLIIILVYFIYNQFFGTILNSLFSIDIYSNWMISLVLDLIFLVFCVYAYNDDINEDFKELKENFGKKVLQIFKYIGLTFLLTIIYAMLTTLIEDIFNVTFNLQNDITIQSLNVVYKIFRTLIFATIAETIVYNQAIKRMTDKNKGIYIIVTCLFYAIMNIIYQPINSALDLFIILFYMIRIIPYCLLHIKTDNIIMIMIMKFIYNLIVLIGSLLGGTF